MSTERTPPTIGPERKAELKGAGKAAFGKASGGDKAFFVPKVYKDTEDAQVRADNRAITMGIERNDSTITRLSSSAQSPQARKDLKEKAKKALSHALRIGKQIYERLRAELAELDKEAEQIGGEMKQLRIELDQSYASIEEMDDALEMHRNGKADPEEMKRILKQRNIKIQEGADADILALLIAQELQNERLSAADKEERYKDRSGRLDEIDARRGKIRETLRAIDNSPTDEARGAALIELAQKRRAAEQEIENAATPEEKEALLIKHSDDPSMRDLRTEDSAHKDEITKHAERLDDNGKNERMAIKDFGFD